MRICNNCVYSKKEFSLYRWNENSINDSVIKADDHAMDDIRYFVSTVDFADSDDVVAVAMKRY